jgi:hypothetical protein
VTREQTVDGFETQFHLSNADPDTPRAELAHGPTPAPGRRAAVGTASTPGNASEGTNWDSYNGGARCRPSPPPGRPSVRHPPPRDRPDTPLPGTLFAASWDGPFACRILHRRGNDSRNPPLAQGRTDTGLGRGCMTANADRP